MSRWPIIQLAAEHKTGLALANPVMPAAGCFGLGVEYAQLVDPGLLGAVVVGPFTGRPRKGAGPPRTLPVPGGVLLHTGLANPGIAADLRRFARVWDRLPVPVIVHVAGTSPEEVNHCCQRLSSVGAVAGIELGLANDVNVADSVALVQAARDNAIQPLLLRLPLYDAGTLCEPLVAAGADALTIGAPPRGTAWHAAGERFVTGRLYGGFVLPLALRALRRVAERVEVPLIGCGGVCSVTDAESILRAGAVAVQVGGALWHDPGCLARIACGVSPPDQRGVLAS